ncbi:hypothetical protein PoB_002204200, partial [Plakobranchus ocellatus]
FDFQNVQWLPSTSGGVNGKVACESALRSAGTILSRVRASPPAPRPDGGPQSLRSVCCRLAIHKNQTKTKRSTPSPTVSWHHLVTNSGDRGLFKYLCSMIVMCPTQLSAPHAG